jgi:outer membrane protein
MRRLVISLCAVVYLSERAFTQQAPVNLTLAQAEQLAIANNPAIASSNFTARAAGQVPFEYSAAFKPTVTGNATGVGADGGSRIAAGALNNPTVYSRVAAGLTLNQMVTDFGRTSNLVKSSKLHADAQNQTAASVRAQIVLEVDRAYFNLQRAQSVRTIAQQTVAARQLISDQVTQLAENKLKSKLDVSFANVNLAQAKIDDAASENDVRAAEAQLATAMGLPSEQRFTLSEEPVPAAPPAEDGDLVREAIQQRPELASLRADAEAAQKFLQAEKDLNRPRIDLIGVAGLVPAGDVQVPNRYGAAGANVTIPILNGGLFKARQNEAALRALAAKSDVDDLQNRVVRDVRVAYLNASTAYQRIALTDQLLQQARLALDLAQGRYQLGLSSIVELSQAELSLTSAQIAYASAKFDYQTQHAVLQFQIGTLR